MNNVGAGTYTVTVTDVNGCVTTASLTVTEPTVLTSSASVTSDYNGQDVSCNGSTDGSISVNPAGRHSALYLPMEYGCHHTIRYRLGGGYVYGDHYGCERLYDQCFRNGNRTRPGGSATAQVTSDYNGQDVSCNGSTDGSVSVNPTGGTVPYTYQWNTGATTQAATVWVRVPTP